MGEAMLVNPYDEERTAETVVRAIELNGDERRVRMSALHERVTRNNVFAWGERFLSTLEDAVNRRSELGDAQPEPLRHDELLAAFSSAARRVMFLDYDGTLVPFAARPQDAVPDREVLDVLSKLASLEGTRLVLVSGRTVADIERWFGAIPGIVLAAEHGARWRAPGQEHWSDSIHSAEWKSTVRPILEHFTDRTPGSCVEEKEFALVWHYRLAEPEFGEWLAMELTAMLDGMLAETELRAFRGAKIVEVKPIIANKGAFASRLLLDSDEDADFILAVGDDRTDEDLFAQVPSHAWTIHVGDGESRAAYSLPHPPSVRDLLRKLVRAAAR